MAVKAEISQVVPETMPGRKKQVPSRLKPGVNLFVDNYTARLQ
jgi:hypothetical protein